MVRIGELNRVVYLQKPTLTSDGIGGQKESWPTTVGTNNIKTWAKIRPASSNRIEQAAHTYLEDTYDFTIRYRSGVTLDKSWCIVFDSKRYMIDSLIEVNEGQRFWIIRAKKVK